MPSLFDPIELGAIRAANRVLMAPLTRTRADANHVPTEMMIEYYRQRAGAGVIISEATGISPQGLGWPNAPGIWNDAQVEAWKPITEAVHKEGGKIVAQLWHQGRLARPDVNKLQPLSPSATRAPYPIPDKNPYGEARAATLDEIKEAIEQYAQAAHNALEAGFDGVQLHGANGYLIDQFLRDGSNLRDDDYGGSVENRIRLLREVTEALIGVWGKDRVSVRLSPNGETQGVDDSAPEKLFPAAAAALDALGIGFLELREPGPDGTFGNTDVPKQSPAIRAVFKGPLILNSDYDVASAEAALASGVADAIAFGRPFIGNPDLVERIESGAEWSADNPQTWYSPGPEGYTDYPALVTA